MRNGKKQRYKNKKKRRGRLNGKRREEVTKIN